MHARQIRRNGRLFKMAYFFTSKRQRPKKVNLCPFMWRVIFIALTFALMACVVAVGLVTLGGVVYMMGYFLWWLTTEFRWDSMVEAATSPNSVVLWNVLLIYALLCGCLMYLLLAPPYIRRWFAKFETVRLIGDYLRAKKEKICPMYDVV